MQEMILQIMDQFGYLGVFLLIAAENIFPPIPSEVILLFGGFMTTYTALNIAGMTAAATLGSVAGAIVLYFVGKIFNKNRLEKIISGRAGRILKLNNSDIEKADSWFDGRGDKTVFFCRFVPLIRSLISIPAGMSEMAMPRFLAYTSLGSLIWNVPDNGGKYSGQELGIDTVAYEYIFTRGGSYPRHRIRRGGHSLLQKTHHGES